jgi:hypothetical protein
MAVGAALVAASAYGGAVGLSTGSLGLEGTVNERLPFHSPVVGGLLLGLIVAVPFTAFAIAAWRRSADVGTWAFGAGVVLVGWIVMEVAVIRELSVFHPIFAAVGVLFMLAGRRAVMTFGPTAGPPTVVPSTHTTSFVRNTHEPVQRRDC